MLVNITAAIATFCTKDIVHTSIKRQCKGKYTSVNDNLIRNLKLLFIIITISSLWWSHVKGHTFQCIHIKRISTDTYELFHREHGFYNGTKFSALSTCITV